MRDSIQIIFSLWIITYLTPMCWIVLLPTCKPVLYMYGSIYGLSIISTFPSCTNITFSLISTTYNMSSLRGGQNPSWFSPFGYHLLYILENPLVKLHWEFCFNCHCINRLSFKELTS